MASLGNFARAMKTTRFPERTDGSKSLTDSRSTLFTRLRTVARLSTPEDTINANCESPWAGAVTRSMTPHLILFPCRNNSGISALEIRLCRGSMKERIKQSTVSVRLFDAASGPICLLSSSCAHGTRGRAFFSISWVGTFVLA